MSADARDRLAAAIFTALYGQNNAYLFGVRDTGETRSMNDRATHVAAALATVVAEARAEALREAAGRVEMPTGVRRALLARADREQP